MQLTDETVKRYVGGEMEIMNQGEGYLFRGPMKEATVVGNLLRVGFEWLAEGEGYPPGPKSWIVCDRPDYEASLEIYTASDIGSGRISLNSHITGETIILYPPDGSKLDPAKVAGLNLAQTS